MPRQVQGRAVKDTPNPNRPHTPFVPGLTEFGADAARRFSDQGELVAKAMTEWQAECSRNVNHFMNETTETIAEIAKCKSPPEVFAVQTRWIQTAFDDYARQITSLMEMSSQIIGSLTGQIKQA